MIVTPEMVLDPTIVALTMPPLESALIYARHGVRIFPARPVWTPKKDGRWGWVVDFFGMSWPSAATTDERQIVEWWSRWPDAAIGRPAEGTGLDYFDLDRHAHHRRPDGSEIDGVAFGVELMQRFGFSPTFTVTASDGRHLSYDDRLIGDLGNSSPWASEGVDLRGPGAGSRGGFVFAPGSWRWRPLVGPDGAPLDGIPHGRREEGRPGEWFSWRPAGPAMAGLSARAAITLDAAVTGDRNHPLRLALPAEFRDFFEAEKKRITDEKRAARGLAPTSNGNDGGEVGVTVTGTAAENGETTYVDGSVATYGGWRLLLPAEADGDGYAFGPDGARGRSIVAMLRGEFDEVAGPGQYHDNALLLGGKLGALVRHRLLTPATAIEAAHEVVPSDHWRAVDDSIWWGVASCSDSVALIGSGGSRWVVERDDGDMVVTIDGVALISAADLGEDGFARGHGGVIGRDTVARHVAVFRAEAEAALEIEADDEAVGAARDATNDLSFKLGMVMRSRRLGWRTAYRLAEDALEKALVDAGAEDDFSDEAMTRLHDAIEVGLIDGFAKSTPGSRAGGGARSIGEVWGGEWALAMPTTASAMASSAVPAAVSAVVPTAASASAVATTFVTRDFSAADVEENEMANAMAFLDFTSVDQGSLPVVAWNAASPSDGPTAVVSGLARMGRIALMKGEPVILDMLNGRITYNVLATPAGRQELVALATREMRHVIVRRAEAGTAPGQWQPIALAGHHDASVWGELPPAATESGSRWVMLNHGLKKRKAGRPMTAVKSFGGSWYPDDGDDWRPVRILRDAVPLARRVQLARYADDDAGLTRESEGEALRTGTGALVVVERWCGTLDSDQEIKLVKKGTGFDEGALGTFRGVLRAPSMGPGGRLISGRGMDRESGYWLEPDVGMDMDLSGPVWSEAEQRAAVAWLLGFFSDVWFADERSRVTALFFVMAGLTKPMWVRSPGWLIGAPSQGYGKTFLANLAGLMVYGEPLPLFGGWSEATSNEMEKSIGAKISEGTGAFMVDNIIGVLPDDGFFSSVLTSDAVEYRKMGDKDLTKLDTTGIQMVLSGNNLSFRPQPGQKSDWPRRLVYTYLERPAGTLANPFDTPESRNARAAAAEARAVKERPMIVFVVLQLMRAHWEDLRSGRFTPGAPLGSFTEVSVVRDCIVRLTGVDVFTAKDVLSVIADDGPGEDDELRIAIAEAWGFGTEWTVKQVMASSGYASAGPPIIDAATGFPEVPPKAALISLVNEKAGKMEPKRYLGRWLKRCANVESRHGIIRRAVGEVDGAAKWKLDGKGF